MDIITFARLHGVLIDRLIEDGKWHRCATELHPRKKNGAYMTRGTYGFIQDHASHLEPVLWKPEKEEIAHLDHEAIARRAAEAAAQIRRDQEQAAKKAGWIMHQCVPGPHPYLAAKGFPDEFGNIWNDEQNKLVKLVIPMRVDGRLVGVQTISNAEGFEKRFQFGQRISEACHVIGQGRLKFFVEGYATGLSVRTALQALKLRYTIIVTFNAGNLLKIARNHREGIVIADNDLPSQVAPQAGGMGLKIAKTLQDEHGLRYWLSDRAPEDFNDFHSRVGLFRASQSLRAAIYQKATA
jgi:putative DNA primase/helicase